jgi:hypothetical protein
MNKEVSSGGPRFNLGVRCIAWTAMSCRACSFVRSVFVPSRDCRKKLKSLFVVMLGFSFTKIAGSHDTCTIECGELFYVGYNVNTL